MNVRRLVVNMVLALSALLGRQRLPELAPSFVLRRRLVLRGLPLSAHGFILTAGLCFRSPPGQTRRDLSTRQIPSSGSPASLTAVPYAATSLSAGVISRQSNFSPTTAFAPAASDISTILATASCRDSVSMAHRGFDRRAAAGRRAHADNITTRRRPRNVLSPAGSSAR